jgi:hypothetical protein
MTIGGHKVGPIVFILGKNIAKCKDMPYGRGLAEIRNSKWPLRCFFIVTGNSKNPYMGNFRRQGDTYAVVGRPSNLVGYDIILINELRMCLELPC